MSRPRAYSTDTVLRRAKNAFWDQGYDRTALSDIEHATGLNRSSIYSAFGSKEGLFVGALDFYINDFIVPLLAPMEGGRARPRDVEGFFMNLAALFRQGGRPAKHGCLWVNSVADVAGRNPVVAARSAEYLQRLRGAFAHALGAGTRPAGPDPSVERRARLLAVTTWGIWLNVRIDAADAAMTCEAVVAELRSGRVGERGERARASKD